ncbi:hypothetical protein FSP39_010922 [Pinctada imbricata]|uniref:Uncharacterized protein n=1 Tax=Pinctada imbricata TaxID=66713 RepID=A0AA88Y009_PINIB|nr:hypothetical protein FSP39_010922 [Pinctada imbricata]
MATTRTRGDFENYIARIQGVVKQLAEIKETFREAIQMNRTYNNVSIAAVPSQIDKLLVNDTEDSEFYSPFNKSLEDAGNIEDTYKIDIRERGKDSIKAMLNAYRDIRNFILQEYMPHTRTAFGVNSLENGGAYYQACLDWHLSFKMSPGNVHQRGLEEVDRIYGEMQKVKLF